VVLELPILIREKYGMLGSILSGITCAGAFAAFMSTFSGLLVSMTSALAHDVYGRMLRPGASPQDRMRMFKFAPWGGRGFRPVRRAGRAVGNQLHGRPGLRDRRGELFPAAVHERVVARHDHGRRGHRHAHRRALRAGLRHHRECQHARAGQGPMGKLFAGFSGINDFWVSHPLLRILAEQPAIWSVPLPSA
jgi:cation/acetate symporter